MSKTKKLGIKRALISVANKAGIDKFAKQLHQLGVEILSTGGTAQALRLQRIPVTDVSDYTGFPEMMAGRLKTLHPKVHGGILARRGIDERVLAEFGIQPIDLIVGNLYPFVEITKNPNCTLEEAIEQIDIGGPAMIRAAAKNHAFVTVVVDPDDYQRIIDEMNHNQKQVSAATRMSLAVKAFSHTSNYDRAISHYLNRHVHKAKSITHFPDVLTIELNKKLDLRYGENPHQQAALYVAPNSPSGTLATGVQLQGTALSYNNLADADAAYSCVQGFSEPACVIVKHANPCGVATAATLLQAYQLAYRTDPISAYGGIIAFNQTLDKKTAESILAQQFVEVIVASEITDGATKVLATKPKIRVLLCSQPYENFKTSYDCKRIFGGYLMQEIDECSLKASELQVVTDLKPTRAEINDLLFAWRVAKFVKSNAIVYAKENTTIGIGAGQMSRVDSARLAGEKASLAQLSVTGAVMASDAFFPFADAVELAAEMGIKAIIQPGGSIRDSEVIACANSHHIKMVFTKIRHFRH